VTVQEIAALMRRHVIAMIMVVAVTAGVGYAFKHTPPTYLEGGTVVFTAPKSIAFPNPYTSLSGNLTQTSGIMAILVMSPQGRQKIQSAGGTAAYDAELVNLYNLQYPNYSDPFVAVTATSANPAEVHRTFTLVTQLLMNELTVRQAQAGAPPVDRIGAHVVGDTGPLPTRGSSKRSLAGLLVLMIVAAFSIAAFLDRHPVWPWLRRRFSRGHTRDRSGDRLPGAVPGTARTRPRAPRALPGSAGLRSQGP
jgi:hypothetical protein